MGVSPRDVIRPGDVVRLTVIREEELSGDFPVNQFGTVVLPLVGEYDVTNESNRSLREKVIRYLQKLRSARDIELVVLRRVRVLGEVNVPGVYPLDPTMSVADAVAMAKGRSQWADEGKVMLRRGGEVVVANLRLDMLLSESTILSGDEIWVPRISWLNRNLSAVVAVGSTVAGIMVTLMFDDGTLSERAWGGFKGAQDRCPTGGPGSPPHDGWGACCTPGAHGGVHPDGPARLRGLRLGPDRRGKIWTRHARGALDAQQRRGSVHGDGRASQPLSRPRK